MLPKKWNKDISKIFIKVPTLDNLLFIDEGK